MWFMNIDIHPTPRARRSGYTLVEMLVSVVLTLTLMYGVAQMFSMVGTSVNDSRALLGIGDRLRATKARLCLDLDGVTSRMTPPAKPDNNEGYFELIEGPVGPTVTVTSRAINTDVASSPVADTTAIDYDDILMFTTRTTTNEPFIGRAVTNAGAGTIESRFAEVAWFLRGRTLYRRVKLVKPDFCFIPSNPNQKLYCEYLYGTNFHPNLTNFVAGSSALKDAESALTKEDVSFENLYDLSARIEGDSGDVATWKWTPNSLADLTKRENRMYHAPINPTTNPSDFLRDRFPFFPQDTVDWQILGLPTIGEASNLNWMLYQWNCFQLSGGIELPPVGLQDNQVPDLINTLTTNPPVYQRDFWNAPCPYPAELDPITDNLSDATILAATGAPESRPKQRVGEDVILNNVIGFDVKVWDPDAPVITDGTNILKPGDPGFPKNYVWYLDTSVIPPQLYVRVPTSATGYSSYQDYEVVARGAFVDLGHNYRTEECGAGNATSILSGPLNTNSGLANPVASAAWATAPTTTPPFIYDTWSTHYEFDGVDQQGDGAYDLSFNGLDDDPDGAGGKTTNNLVDDDEELDTMPPYPVPLTAIQIKIRVFEPDSRQVREVTIVHKF